MSNQQIYTERWRLDGSQSESIKVLLILVRIILFQDSFPQVVLGSWRWWRVNTWCGGTEADS